VGGVCARARPNRRRTTTRGGGGRLAWRARHFHRPALRTELDAALAANANVVDLSEATFIDSSVVGVLFDAATPPVRIVAIAAAPGTLPRRLIDMLALTATVPVFDSREASVAYATSEHT